MSRLIDLNIGGKRPGVLRHRFRRAIRSRTVLQAGIFTAATTVGSLFGAVSKGLLAQLVTVSEFGSFSFGVSFLQLAGMLFEFGLFLPVARLAAASSPSKRRELIGAALVVYVPVGLGFNIAVFGSSFGVDEVFSVHSAGALRAAAPLAFAYPFSLVALLLCQGVDRLHLFSMATPLGNAAFAGFLAAALVLGTRLNATSALVVSSAALVVGFVPLVLLMRPVVHGVVRYARTFIREARAYGFQVYVGRVLALGTYQMDVLMLGAMTSSRTVGLYVLAGAIANVIGVPSAGIGNALFDRLSRSGEIAKRWLVMSWAIGGVGVAAVWLLTGPFLGAVFPASYSSASTYVVPLALAAALRGTTTVYNTYLSAHGLGRDLRNAAYVLTVSNVALNLALIPLFGGLGAAWASAAALLANLIAHMMFYRRQRSGHTGATEVPQAASAHPTFAPPAEPSGDRA